MPAVLRKACLIASEVNVFCVSPVPLHGRIDHLFQLPSGKCVIADTKFREEPVIYDSDVIQLSAYRLILQNCRYQDRYHRHIMEPYGFIRFVSHDRRGGLLVRYEKTELFTNNEVIELWKRYQRIHYGLEEAVCSCGGEFHSFIPPAGSRRAG